MKNPIITSINKVMPELTGQKADGDFLKMLEGYSLTTANILYRLPDHPKLLQSFLWQTYDVAPKFPVVTRFLDYWERELDGKLHHVTISHSGLITPKEFRIARGVFALN